MEKKETKLVEALMKDFAELYVKEYITNWREGRLVRNLELGTMSLKNTEEYISQELDKAREEGRKEKDIASDFLYWHPLGGGMPDSSIRIGVEFEVGGCHEDWGFVIEQNGKTISSGRTLKEAISKLTTK